jgi:hypothetical protein
VDLFRPAPPPEDADEEVKPEPLPYSFRVLDEKLPLVFLPNVSAEERVRFFRKFPKIGSYQVRAPGGKLRANGALRASALTRLLACKAEGQRGHANAPAQRRVRVAQACGVSLPGNGEFKALLAADTLFPEGSGQPLSAADRDFMWDVSQVRPWERAHTRSSAPARAAGCMAMRAHVRSLCVRLTAMSDRGTLRATAAAPAAFPPTDRAAGCPSPSTGAEQGAGRGGQAHGRRAHRDQRRLHAGDAALRAGGAEGQGHRGGRRRW